MMLVLTCFDAAALWPSAVGVFGVSASIFLFFRGFRMLQYKRLILNTPLSKIRSASMGLVEVSGVPVGPHTLTSPVTGEPCFYYSVRAWQWSASGGRGSWKRVLDESVCLSFFVEDSTGKVLVNPQGAHLDVHRDFFDEIHASTFERPGLIADQLRKFLLLRGLVPYDKIQIEERVIKPSYPLFVFGTLGENPGSSWSALPHVAGVQPGLGLSVLNVLSRLTSADSLGVALGLAKLPGLHIERATTTVPLANGGPLAPPGRVDSASLQRLGSPSQIPAAQQNTVGPNPSAGQFDLHPRFAIGKGERGDPFVISSESQREVVQSLGWKSAALIWGSPVLTIAFVYFLIVFWASR